MIVADLPRRIAHVIHALLRATENGGPALASEVCIYDGEALSVRETGAALSAASRYYALAHYTGGNNGRLWIAGNLALDAQMIARAAELGVAEKADDPAATDRLWSQIVGGTPFDTTKELEDDFWSFVGDKPDDATAAQMRSYLAEQTARATAAKATA